MAGQFSTTDSYTPEEMVALWTRASAEIAATGVSYAIAGRQLTKANAREIHDSIEFWELRCDASNGAPATNLARFQRR